VDSSGLVHVIGSGDQILVIASIEVENIVHADTLVLNVTDESAPPAIATFTIHPDIGDSAKVGVSNTATIFPRAYTADATPIPDVAVYFWTSDKTTADIDRTTGFVVPHHPGPVTIYAATVTFGVVKTDSLPYLIGHPVQLILSVFPQRSSSGQTIGVFGPSHVILGPGAIVLFFSQGAPPTDLTFDDPTNIEQDDRDCPLSEYLCGTGSIEAFALDPNDPTGLSSSRARRFPVPGTYNFHSTLFGSSGSIVVADEHIP
jgi:hypothetical protein